MAFVRRIAVQALLVCSLLISVSDARSLRHDPTFIDYLTESRDDTETPKLQQKRIEHMDIVDTDMMLTPKQYQHFYGQSESVDTQIDYAEGQQDTKLIRNKRKAMRNEDYLWKNNTVWYKFKAGDFKKRHVKVIKRAMKAWEKNTCIKFKEAAQQSDYVLFEHHDGRCASYTGKTGGEQKLFLAPKCIVKRTVIHELGHALGFVHEHNRPDRDDYVDIVFKNVRSEFKNNFKKYSASSITTLGVPYDYKSIMHYGPRLFSKNGRPTIKVTKDKRYQKMIGRARKLSFNDIKQANILYSCGGHCDSSITCPDQGFLGKDCKCYCPGKRLRICGPADFHQDKTDTSSVASSNELINKREFNSNKPCKDNWKKQCPLLKAGGSCRKKNIRKSCPLSCGVCS